MDILLVVVVLVHLDILHLKVIGSLCVIKLTYLLTVGALAVALMVRLISGVDCQL